MLLRSGRHAAHEPETTPPDDSTTSRRWARLACSRTSCLRVRSRARNSCVGVSGTKLARISPCVSRSASQSASATSILRQGTFCAALAKMSANSPSESTCQTGRQ